MNIKKASMLMVVLFLITVYSNTSFSGIINVSTNEDELNTIPNDQCSIREAIFSANRDQNIGGCTRGFKKDTINIPEGFYRLTRNGNDEDENFYGDYDILSDIVIIGAGSDLTIIDAEKSDRHFDIYRSSDSSGYNLTLKHLTLCNGYNDLGGAIYHNGHTLLMENVNILSNKAGLGGGLITLSKTISNLISCKLDSNSSSDGGGVITNISNDTLFMKNCSMENNLAGTLGGCIHNMLNSTTILNDCQFVRNNAHFGGAIDNDKSTCISFNCTFSNNGRASVGGAIHNRGTGFLKLQNCHISKNEGFGAGGGIINLGQSTMIIEQCTIDSNLCFMNGGGINNSNSHLTVVNSTIENNTAIYNGGGIMNDTNAVLLLNSSTIQGNIAGEYASGIYHGGGIYNTNNAAITLTNTTVSGNYAERGGGISNQGNLITLTHCTITDNICRYNGCGLNAESTEYIYNSIIANNLRIRYDTVNNDIQYNMEIDINNLTSGDPLLGPLQDNGGPTSTYALLPGSPAIENGDPLYCLNADQRGQSRPNPIGTNCDIGAFETNYSTTGVLSKVDFTMQIIHYNQSIGFQFSLTTPSLVHLAIFDLNGKIVKELNNKYLTPESYRYTWNCTNASENRIACGIYLIRIEVNDYSLTYKLLVVR